MTNPQNDIDALPWKKISRRWITVLCVTLLINGVTVGLAVCDWSFTTQVAAAVPNAGETPDIAAADQQADAIEVPEIVPQKVAPTSSGSGASVATISPGSGEEASVQPVETAQTTREPTAGPPVDVAYAAADTRDLSAVPATNPSATSPVAVKAQETNDTDIQGQAETVPTDSVLIFNPPSTGGVVHYMIDGHTITLIPGEYHRLTAGKNQRVAFHRGDDLSDTERTVGAGAFVFSVSEAGWELLPIQGAACQRLLMECRPIESSSGRN